MGAFRGVHPEIALDEQQVEGAEASTEMAFEVKSEEDEGLAGSVAAVVVIRPHSAAGPTARWPRQRNLRRWTIFEDFAVSHGTAWASAFTL